MTDCNRAAVDVHNSWIPTHVFIDRTGLRGEGFIGFYQVKIADRPTGFIQGFAAGVDGSDPHDCWVKPGCGIAGDTGQWLQATFFSLFCGHQQHGSSPIVEARRVGCGNCAAVTQKGGPHFLHGLEGGAVTDIFIGLNNDIALAG